ncbi:MAG: GNAT family N-acetyltransferase [Chloroflexi bacterium]|nr:GNAT family N-acetyltransferase [Chloroflexota bacterium]MBI3169060.1 GNAT family N-acetyltransferase [Chloroflexota bacterium]
MIAIRKATVEDASPIATVHVVAWKETYRGIVPDEVLNNLSIQRRTEQWVNSLSDTTHAYHHAFVAEADGQVVGFANFGSPQEKDSGFDGELFAIYILHAAHKQGVGRMLVNAAVNGLREEGHTSMMVWVLKDNPARGFYERLGGVYLYEKPIEIGGEKLMEVAYGWRNLDKFPA